MGNQEAMAAEMISMPLAKVLITEFKLCETVRVARKSATDRERLTDRQGGRQRRRDGEA
jgi:hypothetical protein